MEKDHRTAVTRSAHYFIAATNHDVTDESPKPRLGVSKTSAGTLKLTGMEGLVEESIDRKKCISQLWYRATNTRRKKYARRGKESVIDEGFVSTETVCDWMDEYPVTNEETHFAVVMDPKEGQIVWIKRYLEPVVHD
ncbi:hypothetical protein MMC06_004355 [Schaereria dolodes]|nr:hypothetical protein [Schaereria dolodes]